MKILKESEIAKMNFSRIKAYRTSALKETSYGICSCCGEYPHDSEGNKEIRELAEKQVKIINKYYFPLKNIHENIL